MILALYKEQADAAERAAQEGGSVMPTEEAHHALAARWPDYPWAVVITPPHHADAHGERRAIEHMSEAA